MLRMGIDKMTPGPSILAMSIHTGTAGEESESFKASGYVSARMESVRYSISHFLSYNHCRIQQLTQYRLNIAHIR